MSEVGKRSQSGRIRQGLVTGGRAACVALAVFGPLGCAVGGDSVEGEATPKVLLIGVDGVRPDILAEVATPNIDALIEAGVFTARARTTTPSVSGPSWSSMLTGVWPEKHRVVDNQFEGRRYDLYPDFLTRIEETRPELETFAAADWLPLMEIEGGGPTLSTRIDHRVPLDGYELGWREADDVVVDASVTMLSQGDPDALFVYLGNPDETSHQFESIGPEYREAIEYSDGQIGRLLEAMRSRPTFETERWLVIVSTDHGRREDGGHGGFSPEEMTIFIVTSGPDATPVDPDRPSFIVDVAATALAHLDIPIDPEWGLDGQPFGVR